MMAHVQQRLRTAGLRVTRPRVAVLEVLEAAAHEQQHLLVAEIVGRARDHAGELSVQGVYDCLEVLTSARLVRRVETAGSPARYEARVGDNHHHLVCRGCGKTVDVDCAVGAAPCLEPAEDHGFVIDEAEVVFWGHCPACSQSRPGINAQT
ncbi:MAG TPA: Fur family transcriptional regulator [Nocardioidaceae bacterium]|nr:Fur family transcriptional regulator [Nocardioidaceae bacterium]